MKAKTVPYYLVNCFLLTLPVMIWNLALTDSLPKPYQPDVFWASIPPVVAYGENGSRIVVFTLAFLMPLKVSTLPQKAGVWVYGLGSLLYYGSWLVLIFHPNSLWSSSMVGFMAPAYTPAFWLAGIGLIGRSFYFNLPFSRWIFGLAAFIFLLFHLTHTYIIFSRIYS
ncbi:hypothetical protein GCM10027347_48090 [Larkinella harenae]